MSLPQLAVVLSVLGFIPYAAYAVRGELKPNPISWLLWALNGGVLCVGHFLAGGTLAAGGVPISQCVGPGVLGAIAWHRFSRERRDLTEIEKLCCCGAAVALGTSVATATPWLALSAGLGVEIFAAIPTLLHLWKAPGEECLSAWILFFLGSVANVLALDQGFSAATIVPWFFVFQTGTIGLLLSVRHSLERPLHLRV